MSVCRFLIKDRKRTCARDIPLESGQAIACVNLPNAIAKLDLIVGKAPSFLKSAKSNSNTRCSNCSLAFVCSRGFNHKRFTAIPHSEHAWCLHVAPFVPREWVSNRLLAFLPATFSQPFVFANRHCAYIQRPELQIRSCQLD